VRLKKPLRLRRSTGTGRRFDPAGCKQHDLLLRPGLRSQAAPASGDQWAGWRALLAKILEHGHLIGGILNPDGSSLTGLFSGGFLNCMFKGICLLQRVQPSG
jgi:hypothetical protein